ncbi:hypothetical protein GGI22_005374 [Coemansia erecta]|nr:hypothetical protein GGI22_005374 [Coemansia erecta]
MPPDILQDAFYRTLLDFPAFAARLKVGADGHMLAVIDKHNLNMPVYSDEYCETDYQELRDAGFDTAKMNTNILKDACLVPVPSKATGGELKLATVRILRFKDYSGVLVFSNLSHAIVDGHGQCAFMNRWSEISKALQQPSSGPIPLNFSEGQYKHDRSIHASYKCEGTDELDPSMCKELSTPTYLSRWMAWISPNSRGRLFRTVASMHPPKRYYFQIGIQTVESLRLAAQDYGAGHNVRYSHNDIITALATAAVAQAMQKQKADQGRRTALSALYRMCGIGSAAKPKNMLASFAVNLRQRVETPDSQDYMGNMVVSRQVQIPLAALQGGVTPKVLATVASGVRQSVAGMSKRSIGQYCTLLNRSADTCMRALVYSSTSKYRVFVSNITRVCYYATDFGAGIPNLVRFGTLASSNMVFVLPCHPASNAYEFSMMVTPDIGHNILQNKSWMQLVDKYSADV